MDDPNMHAYGDHYAEITEAILRDVCELEPANPNLNDTLCVDVSDLKIIVDRALMNAQAPNAQQAEPHGRPVSERAAELAADPVRGPRIEAMREKLAQQAEVQEPFAFAYEYIHGKTLLTLERQEDWADNEIQLFTRPQPAQLERLSEEETVTAWRGVKDVGDDKYNAILLSEAIQSALAAKNWAVLAAAAMAPEEAE